MIDLSRYAFEALWKEEEFTLYRGRSEDDASRVLLLSPVAEYPRPESLKRLEHAYSLRKELDLAWAARPIAIARHWDRPVLVLEDPGGVPLDQLLGQPLDIAFSLRLAVSLSTVIGHLHQRGVVHKDINIFRDKSLAEAECTHLLITVRDSGPGLDPQRLNHLFDAFYTTNPQGLGMGLTICRSIIEAHGGRLRAKANTPRGAVFEFTLPIRDATHA